MQQKNQINIQQCKLTYVQQSQIRQTYKKHQSKKNTKQQTSQKTQIRKHTTYKSKIIQVKDTTNTNQKKTI